MNRVKRLWMWNSQPVSRFLQSFPRDQETGMGKDPTDQGLDTFEMEDPFQKPFHRYNSVFFIINQCFSSTLTDLMMEKSGQDIY